MKLQPDLPFEEARRPGQKGRSEPVFVEGMCEACGHTSQEVGDDGDKPLQTRALQFAARRSSAALAGGSQRLPNQQRGYKAVITASIITFEHFCLRWVGPSQKHGARGALHSPSVLCLGSKTFRIKMGDDDGANA